MNGVGLLMLNLDRAAAVVTPIFYFHKHHIITTVLLVLCVLSSGSLIMAAVITTFILPDNYVPRICRRLLRGNNHFRQYDTVYFPFYLAIISTRSISAALATLVMLSVVVVMLIKRAKVLNAQSSTSDQLQIFKERQKKLTYTTILSCKITLGNSVEVIGDLHKMFEANLFIEPIQWLQTSDDELLLFQQCFKAAFSARITSDLPDINRRFKKAFIDFSKTSAEVEYFLKCVRFAIELVCEKSTEKESRARCLRMVSYIAVLLAKNQMSQLLDALIDFCKEVHGVTLVAPRMQICFLIGLLLNADALISGRLDDLRESFSPNDLIIPKEQRKGLYEIMLERRLDVSASVRAEVLKAMSFIQNDPFTFMDDEHSSKQLSPLEILRLHFRDESSDCQMVAVKIISVTAKEEIDLMVDMALSNAETKVRRAALSRLAKDVDLKALTIAQRMELLKSVMQSRETSIRCSALDEVLSEWLKVASDRGDSISTEDSPADPSEYCFAPAKLLRFLEPFNDERTSHDLMVAAFRRCRENLHLSNLEMQQFVKTLIDNASNNTIHSHNYKNLLDRRMSSLEQANAAFVWRCMLDYCKLESTSETDWMECKYRLLPTLHTFCDFIIKKSFRNLAESILTDRKLDVSRELVDCVIRHMFTYIWPRPEDNDEALSAICDLTSSMVDRSVNPNATVQMANETISIVASVTSADVNVSLEPQEIDDDTLLRCMKIVSAMLKTNRYRVMNALLRGLLENLVEKCVVCVNSECRILAFEAMGILAMYDERLAFEKVVLIKDTLELDDDLKPTSLNILCNMCLLHGYTSVAKWFAGSAVDFCDPRNDLIRVFLEYVEDENERTSFAACECLCKLLLSETRDEWTNVLATLFLKAFDPRTDNNARLKACLVAFIPTYAESDRSHQLLLVEAFPEIFGLLRNAVLEGLFTEKKLSVIGSCLVCATLKQSRNTQCRQESSVQSILCRKILAAIEGDPDPEGHFLPVYCKMLSQLEVSEWEDIEELNFFRDKAEELVMKDMEASAHDINVLMAFSRSLNRRIETLENSSKKWQPLSSPTTDELAVLTEELHLETPIKGEQKERSVQAAGRRFVHITSIQNGQASTKAISSKPISSSTTRRVSLQQNELCLLRYGDDSFYAPIT
uniref:Nuclear condensin complex subunit 3 C-terminal domain-containing protein n=1 Tax=Ascaris lumbricoides TaxID=6252 RepID=A0A9J2PKM0_ASCLU